MRKKVIICVLLIFVVCATALWVRASFINYPNIQGAIWAAWSGDYGQGIKNDDSILYFWTKSGGKIEFYETPDITDANKLLEISNSRVTVYRNFTMGDSSSDALLVNADTKVTVFSRPATVINSYTQLSSWAGTQGATNGVSYIQAEAGKEYEIDLAAIGKSLPGMNFAGVTIVANDATAANDQMPFAVTIIPPTGSTPASLVSGVSPVFVVPNPGSGATSYGANATPTPQSMQGDYQDANGVLTEGAVGNGVSTMFLTKIGESAEFETRHNSGVSLFVKKATVKK